MRKKKKGKWTNNIKSDYDKCFESNIDNMFKSIGRIIVILFYFLKKDYSVCLTCQLRSENKNEYESSLQ